MKLKKILLETNISKIWMVCVIMAAIIMIGTYFSYAMFTVSAEKKDALSIATGNLTASMTITGYSATTIPAGTRSVTIPANSTKTVLVTITSNNSISARFNFYYVGTLASGVTIGYTDASGFNTPPAATGTTLNAKGSTGSSVIYQVVLKNTTTSSQTVTFGAQMGLSYNNLNLPSNGHVVPKYNFDTLLERLVAISSETTSYSSSTDGEKQQPYVFTHTAGTQQDTYDEDDLKDYRYIGSNPSNYIRYNGDTWRIIGVFTTDDPDGQKDQYIKIIKNTSSTTFPYDGTNSRNDWVNASLNSAWNVDNEAALTSEALGMASFVKWYLGGNNLTNGGGAVNSYSRERGTTVYSGHNNYWNGKIGLLYPSDYFYTYANGIYSTCFSSGSCTGSARTNSWLYKSGINWWTITPNSASNNSALAILSTGAVNISRSVSYYSYTSYPVVYLTGDLKYTRGTGTSSNPYRVEANNTIAVTSFWLDEDLEEHPLKYIDGTEVKDGDRFKIVPYLNSNFAIDIASGLIQANTNIQLWTATTNNAAQQFVAYRAGGVSNELYHRYYYISSYQEINLNLDVYGNTADNGANIQLYTRNYSLGQRFTFVEVPEVSGNYYYLATALTQANSNRTCLDIDGGIIEDGRNIQSYECNHSNAQMWGLVKV